VRSRNPDLFQSSDGEILRNTPKAFGIRFGSLPKSFFAHRRFFRPDAVGKATGVAACAPPRAAGAQVIQNCLAETMTNAHTKLQFRYSFRQNFNLEALDVDPNLGFDGGVLEINVDQGKRITTSLTQVAASFWGL
jgi:hypothetical protein